MFNLIRKLCRPLSVSGREETIAGVIAEEIARWKGELLSLLETTDTLQIPV